MYLLLRRDGSAHRDDEVTEKVECRVVEDVRFRLEHLDKQLELVHLGFWQRRHLAPTRVRVGFTGYDTPMLDTEDTEGLSELPT